MLSRPSVFPSLLLLPSLLLFPSLLLLLASASLLPPFSSLAPILFSTEPGKVLFRPMASRGAVCSLGSGKL